MKLDRFIKRPVLSTVISILIVILGILGLVSLPITQYPDIAIQLLIKNNLGLHAVFLILQFFHQLS